MVFRRAQNNLTLVTVYNLEHMKTFLNRLLKNLRGIGFNTSIFPVQSQT